MKKSNFLYLLLSGTLLVSCLEEKYENQPLTTGTIRIDSTAWVASTGKDKSKAFLTGRVLTSGGLEIVRGAILDTSRAFLSSSLSPETIIRNSLRKDTDLVGGVGKFTLGMETPKGRTKYYYRFFVNNFRGTELSPVDSLISAPNLPSLSDIFLTLPSRDSAQFGAFLKENGGELLISKGYVVSKLSGPVVETGIVGLSSPDSAKIFFRATVKGLEPNTNYRVRAFAKNRGGIQYSKEKSFKTLP